MFNINITENQGETTINLRKDHKYKSFSLTVEDAGLLLDTLLDDTRFSGRALEKLEALKVARPNHSI